MSSRRLLGTTKGKLLVSLCRGRQTVAELAGHLGVTENAVRAQLERLQRDGLVRLVGSRRGVRKPHAEYELTSAARELFPRAYQPALEKVVDVLAERLPRDAARDLLLAAARRLVTEHLGELRERSPRRRLAEVMSKLNGSGVGIELEEQSAKTVVRSCSCPVAAVTASHPELCGIVATVFGEVLGANVHERCKKGESPQCCFEIGNKGGKARGRAPSRPS